MDDGVVDRRQREGGAVGRGVVVDAVGRVGDVAAADACVAVVEREAVAVAVADERGGEDVDGVGGVGDRGSGDAGRVGVAGLGVFDDGRARAEDAEGIVGVVEPDLLHLGDGVVEAEALPVTGRGAAARGGEEHGAAGRGEDLRGAGREVELDLGGAVRRLPVERPGAAHVVGRRDVQACAGLEGDGAARRHNDVAEDGVGGAGAEGEGLPEEAFEVGADAAIVPVAVSDEGTGASELAEGRVLGRSVVAVGDVGVERVVGEAGACDGVGGVAARVAPEVGVGARHGDGVADAAAVAEGCARIVGDRHIVDAGIEVVARRRVAGHIDGIAGVVGDGDAVEREVDRAVVGGVAVDGVVAVVVDLAANPVERGVAEVGALRGAPRHGGVEHVDARRRARRGDEEAHLVAVEVGVFDARRAALDVDAILGAVVDGAADDGVVVGVEGDTPLGVGDVDLAHVEGQRVGGDDDAVPVAARGRGGRRGDRDLVGVGAVELKRTFDAELRLGGVETAGHGVGGGEADARVGLEGEGGAGGDDHVAAGVGDRAGRKDLVGVPEAVEARARGVAGVGHSSDGLGRVGGEVVAGGAPLRGGEVAVRGVLQQRVVAEEGGEVGRLREDRRPDHAPVEAAEGDGVADRAGVAEDVLARAEQRVAEVDIGVVTGGGVARAHNSTLCAGRAHVVEGGVGDGRADGAVVGGVEVDAVAATVEDAVVDRQVGRRLVDGVVAVLEAAVVDHSCAGGGRGHLNAVVGGGSGTGHIEAVQRVGARRRDGAQVDGGAVHPLDLEAVHGERGGREAGINAERRVDVVDLGIGQVDGAGGGDADALPLVGRRALRGEDDRAARRAAHDQVAVHEQLVGERDRRAGLHRNARLDRQGDATGDADRAVQDVGAPRRRPGLIKVDGA